MFFAEMTIKKWLKMRGSANKENSRDLKAPFTVICYDCTFTFLKPCLSVQSSHLFCWKHGEKVSGVTFPGHHHQLDSPQPDYSSFSLLLMQMLPPASAFPQW